MRQLAEAVGLSQAGLLHYFDSKEELFTSVLRKRDEVQSRAFTREQEPAGIDEFLALVRDNADVPGLVRLYVNVSAAASDPDHAGHDYFRARTAHIRSLFVPVLTEVKQRGRLPDDLDPQRLARILVAITDGLQVQWLMDPSIDMAADIAAVLHALGIDASADRAAALDAAEPALEA